MDALTLRREGNIAVLTLNRPPANAIDLPLGEALPGALARAAEGAAALVVAGTPPFFSAGVDLKAVPGYTPEQQRGLILSINRLVYVAYGLPIPVVAAVTGHATGGGLILALCADYRVGAAGLWKLGLPEVRAGIPFPEAPLRLVQAELSPQAARLATLGAENFLPQEALALGFVDELQEMETVLPRALMVAERLAALPRAAYQRTKMQLRGAFLEQIRAAAEGDDPALRGWLDHDTPGAAAAALRKE